jgi:hypothetical protein
MTARTEASFAFIGKTIDTELVEELRFLAEWDHEAAIREGRADWPSTDWS